MPSFLEPLHLGIEAYSKISELTVLEEVNSAADIHPNMTLDYTQCDEEFLEGILHNFSSGL